MWSPEQVEGLAPDAASVVAGRKLATTSTWSELGADDEAVWGLCRGSGKNPYQAQVDLAGPAFRCSCPSRKFPCKHALALLLLWARQPDVMTASRPPWVDEWLASRAERAERTEKRAAARETPPDPVAQAQRVAARDAKVRSGIAELEMFLGDLVRGGFAGVQTRPFSYFDGAAARLVDAQAPGLAGRVRRMAGIPASGAVDWPARLLEQASMLHVIAAAHQRTSPEAPPTDALFDDVRTAIGFTTSQDLVRSSPAVRDHWHVIGKVVTGLDEGDRVASQRVWLVGRDTGRFALSLSFAPPGQPFDTSFVFGTSVDASLAFFPGAVPRRALLVEHHGEPRPIDHVDAAGSFDAALGRVAGELGDNPLLDRHPMLVGGAVLERVNGRLQLCDSEGRTIDSSVGGQGEWTVLAVTGGHPVTVFGEWNHRELLVLSVATEDRWFAA